MSKPVEVSGVPQAVALCRDWHPPASLPDFSLRPVVIVLTRNAAMAWVVLAASLFVLPVAVYAWLNPSIVVSIAVFVLAWAAAAAFAIPALDAIFASRARRRVTFEADQVSVTDSILGQTVHWSAAYREFDGIVLRVQHGEIQSFSTEFIDLSHAQAARTIPLWSARGTGLDPATRARARNLAHALGVAAFVEIGGTLVPFDREP